MFSVLLVSNPSTLLDHTEARKAEKGVFFFLETANPLYLRVWMTGPPYPKAWSVTGNKVSLYRGSFTYMLLLLGWRRSFVIPRTLLYRCLLYRGSTVWRNLGTANKLCQSLGPSVLICRFQCNTTNFWQPENTDTTLSWCFTTIHLFSLFLFSRIHFVPFLQKQLLH